MIDRPVRRPGRIGATLAELSRSGFAGKFRLRRKLRRRDDWDDGKSVALVARVGEAGHEPRACLSCFFASRKANAVPRRFRAAAENGSTRFQSGWEVQKMMRKSSH